MTKSDFRIPFKGLSAGKHSFDFEIGEKFFASYAYFEGISGELEARVELLKESGLMNLDFRLNGTVNVPCDRCLAHFDQAVEGTFRLIVKFGDKLEEQSDEVLVLPFGESILDLKPHLFDFVSMLLPLQMIHPDQANGDSGCDPEMIERLNQYAEPQHDPRWDALKNIKLK